ncbi:MAG: pyridoxamine 5'-phosphate oxidase family protein [Chloroflexi bacterium]|nr:pyridoxamine 5'-phosphate oxidase family protein [Chloroflexota bacterium]MCI0862024.1 pyridoxamine 5'-phosphate oxidase family protein [Chloroflexota bacterium]MCI0876863.1 pyridoxamine 5'-phosphate oxidase family protein [Chloroflexota bacterium]MDK1046278.1 pyridoxamine 5'-phosphate oxidase family protein [Anaerolineales bacterium]
MDTETQVQLKRLLGRGRFAALGSLHEGAPFVSLVLYTASLDLTSFYIHISSLAIHTQNILADPRASLMVYETWEDGKDPQSLARISIQGNVEEIKPEEDRFGDAKLAYLEKNPQAERNFKLADFRLFEFRAESARFVGGFGHIVDLGLEDLREVAREKG